MGHIPNILARCDRVLWKSTVQPDPEPEEDESFDFPASRPRTRMSQFFANAFRPLSGRARRGSYSSFTSAASVTTSATTDADVSATDSIPASPEQTEQIAPFSRFVEPPGRVLSHSRSNEVFNVNPKPPAAARTLSTEGLHRSKSSSSPSPPSPMPLSRSRRATVSPDSLGPLTTALQNHSRITTPSRWRFFPSFLSHGSTQSNSSHDASLSIDTLPPRPPRRGEVLCLNYNTLDDRAMRRLEGKFLFSQSVLIS